MHQVTVNADVAVVQGVSIGEAESEDCGGDDRLERPVRTAVEGGHPGDQGREVLRLRTNVLGHAHPVFSVARADKAAVFAKAERDKPRVADHDFLQSRQVLPVQRPAARSPDGPVPALNTALRRGFALYPVARQGGILEQQQGDRPGAQIARHVPTLKHGPRYPSHLRCT